MFAYLIAGVIGIFIGVFIHWLFTPSSPREDWENPFVDHSGANHRAPLKVPVVVPKKFHDEAAWNHTMSAKDRKALLNIFGYAQHRLLMHPECGLKGIVSLEKVQKFIKELS